MSCVVCGLAERAFHTSKGVAYAATVSAHGVTAATAMAYGAFLGHALNDDQFRTWQLCAPHRADVEQTLSALRASHAEGHN